MHILMSYESSANFIRLVRPILILVYSLQALACNACNGLLADVKL